MKKAVENLQPGDIIDYGTSRYVVVNVEKSVDVRVFQVRLGVPVRNGHYTGVGEFTRMPGCEFNVEPRVGEVAPEDLATLLEAARFVIATGGTPGQRERMRDVVERLEPPKPPTVDELVRALVETRERTEAIDELLDRARKSGML